MFKLVLLRILNNFIYEIFIQGLEGILSCEEQRLFYLLLTR